MLMLILNPTLSCDICNQRRAQQLYSVSDRVRVRWLLLFGRMHQINIRLIKIPFPIALSSVINIHYSKLEENEQLYV